MRSSHLACLLTSSLLTTPAAAAIQADALAVLPAIPPDGDQQQYLQPPQQRSQDVELDFTLRHIFHHGTHSHSCLHRRLDVPKNAEITVASEGDVTRGTPRHRLKPRRQHIQRLADRRQESIDALLDAGRDRGRPLTLGSDAWTVDELWGPNVTDKETVLSLARIAADAYVLDRSDPEWQDVGCGFNYTEDFGWDNDGLRGHVFADTQNETVIIGIKGTSPVFDGTETTTNDKINDNLFFSCCCGQGGQYTWHQVCDCQTSAYKCNSTCVTHALRNKNRYYYAAQEIYRNVSEIYPNAEVWLAGHSLGGSTASLVGLTYGLPVVTFEAPGEAMPAARLGLPTPPGYQVGFGDKQVVSTGGWHFGHTADPIFMGTCNTFTSVCTIGGYAMQSRCHTGLTCIYDTVADLGWRSSSTTHKIVSVIKDVLLKYDEPAKCAPMVNCTDCFNWEFYESNHSDTTTSTRSSTSTRTTRTSTCKTPGWWGCLDETTTSGEISTRSDFSTSVTTTSTTTTETQWTTTTTTSHCATPGWWGCKDTTPSSTSTSEAQPSPTSSPTSASETSQTTHTTSTCKDPGWFGCNDPVSTSTEVLTTTVTETSTSLTVTTDAPSPSSSAPSPTESRSSSTCSSHKYFGFVCADPTSTSTSAESPSPTSAHCVKRGWFGRCKEYEWDGGDGEWSLGVGLNVDL